MSHTDKTAPYSISHQSPRRKVVREECKRFTRQERRRLKVWLRQASSCPTPSVARTGTGTAARASATRPLVLQPEIG